MKAFTVYQPYAYAIVAGLKQYETRPRWTHIRGRVAVHAGKSSLNCVTRNFSCDELWELLDAIGGKIDLPLGAVVGTVEIVGCVPVEDIVDSLSAQEKALGDYSPGRKAWVLKNPIMFDTPIPARGKQGWWNWEGMKIWVDDVRPVPDETYTAVQSVDDCIGQICACEDSHIPIEVIDLDHDSGAYFGCGGDYIKILDWLEATGRNYPIRIHSMNPVGVKNMRRIIHKNGWAEIQ